MISLIAWLMALSISWRLISDTMSKLESCGMAGLAFPFAHSYNLRTPTEPNTSMSDSIFDGGAKWIWSSDAKRAGNNFVCFRRTFDVESSGAAQAATLRVTADSRYEV